MDDRIRAWLYEILKAIQEIETYFEEHEKNLQHFTGQIIKKRAVERNLEVIGNFLGKVASALPGSQLSQVNKITDTSRRLMKADVRVSDDLLWDIMTNDLPRLREEIHVMIIQSSH